jgi:hypothetical protein
MSEQVDIESKRVDAGLTTKVAAIMRLDDVDEDTAMAEVKDIDKETALAMPAINPAAAIDKNMPPTDKNMPPKPMETPPVKASMPMMQGGK